MKNLFTAFDAKLYKILVALIALMFSLLVLLISAQVCVRYFTNFSLAWSEELSTYLMIWMALLASILAFRNGTHISVDALTRILPDTVRPLVLLIGTGLNVLFYLMVLFGCFKLLPALHEQHSPVMGIPLSALYIAMPISMVLSCFYLLKSCYDEYLNFVGTE